jgi:hypothetical protein
MNWDSLAAMQMKRAEPSFLSLIGLLIFAYVQESALLYLAALNNCTEVAEPPKRPPTDSAALGVANRCGDGVISD